MSLIIGAFITAWLFYALIIHDLCIRGFSVLQYEVTIFRKVWFYVLMVFVGSNPFAAPFIIERFEKLIVSYE